MFEKPIFRVALRYGALAALASFIILVLFYVAGKNPYGQNGFYALFLLPVFLVLGTGFLRRKIDPELKFFKGLKFGWLVTLIAAVTFGILVYAFTNLAGTHSIQKHVQEMKAMMEQNKAQFLKLPNGQQAYQYNYEQLDLITPQTLMLDNFIKLLLIGFLFSFVSATFYRK
ncbi:DUF4199 domain-containing protein [Adhaeribacter pallidiroseus]|uniref:DUF4199 domain-containing protein n=1 Tax=Adhaeribacter pallidiroseus TaxID=2072847 RepID=A0A369QG42_9BACT|nr:DUF4199 domain-containing protein [Adhaeribacter pallidiroseus]RDC63392.1 hypothetical protein AHMF7616_01995 [Adhaeribacter pallidiroseus]